MKTFKVKLTGTTPLLHHRMTEEQLMGLLGNKGGKKAIKVDRTPREIAESHAYKNSDGTYYIPTSYISGAFIQASSDYKQKNSARKSYKSVAGGIFRPLEETATLLQEDEKPVTNFEVDIKKATNHKVGAVAVCRPRFDKWQTEITLTIDDTIIDADTARQILDDAGRRVGIGSFRVSKGGYYGQFKVDSWAEIK